MALYRCSLCGKLLQRDGTKNYIESYCTEKEQTTTIKAVHPTSETRVDTH